MTSNAVCATPANTAVIGRATYPFTANYVFRYIQTMQTGDYSPPDVFLGGRLASAPTSSNLVDNGGKIFVQTTSDFDSQESYS